MTDSPVVEVERLNSTRGDLTAVRDLSFEVERGGLYALLGTNGAGNTPGGSATQLSTIGWIVAITLAGRLFRWEPRQ